MSTEFPKAFSHAAPVSLFFFLEDCPTEGYFQNVFVKLAFECSSFIEQIEK